MRETSEIWLTRRSIKKSDIFFAAGMVSPAQRQSLNLSELTSTLADYTHPDSPTVIVSCDFVLKKVTIATSEALRENKMRNEKMTFIFTDHMSNVPIDEFKFLSDRPCLFSQRSLIFWVGKTEC